MTDYMPIIIPTEKAVDATLKGTSHQPRDVVGRIRSTEGVWQYTVKQARIDGSATAKFLNPLVDATVPRCIAERF